MQRPEISVARKLRREMTLPEILLWRQFRGQAIGLKFRKQHPIGPYVVDFCCLSERLVIEVDGEVHASPEQAGHDQIRDRFLTENGFRVLRIAAVDILRNIEAVMLSIVSLAARPLHHASHGPPPRAGEE